MKEHQTAIDLVKNYRQSDKLNEADTRHQIIDELIHGVLSWPKPAVKIEKYATPGFADYVFYRPDKSPILVVEAKQQGNYFTLPTPTNAKETSSHKSLRTLLTNESIANAIKQARDYCLEIGSLYGAITNGHQWIFFRAFCQGVDWRTLKAFVISDLNYFSESFTDAHNKFNYLCVTRNNVLNELLPLGQQLHRDAYYPKEIIHNYLVPVSANKFANYLRPIANDIFGNIDETNTELMESCYVSDKEYDSAFKSAMGVLKDSLTPYLEQYNIRDTKNDDGGGEFGNRIEKSVREGRANDVMVLFGGKGVGKSTFLRRLLFHRPPQIIKKYAVSVVIDLLDVPKEESIIHKQLWNKLARGLDECKIMQSDRDRLLTLFSDKFELAKKQTLYGLDQAGNEYNTRLNDHVKEWLQDDKYCAQRLAAYHSLQHKGVVIVIDNTDQFGTELQEFCFTTAHEISKLLGCLVIISMREERFYASSIHGVLDAYQNSGFHIHSPSPHFVFLRRLQFLIRLLSNSATQTKVLPSNATPDVVRRLKQLFRTFEHEFKTESSHLAGFLSACAHGNIRLALELFRGILQSSYTNVGEITSRSNLWTYQLHQVLKPIMIPFRFYYEETQSHVPNIFQVRSKKNGSHFTGLRILSSLYKNGDALSPQYTTVASLTTEFIDKFHMDEDFFLNLDIFLRYGLVEANNRLDEYTDDVDSIRLTSYGMYLFKDLSTYFTYIELVSVDTLIFDQAVSNTIALLSNEEYALWEEAFNNPNKRTDRVHKRLERAKLFLEYLRDEEHKEAASFGLGDKDLFMPKIITCFDAEQTEVKRSASKQKYRDVPSN